MARILLVEDDPHLADLYSQVLIARSHCVSIASNGQEALDYLSDQQPDLILMDIQMPVMDGLEATARIKDSEHRDIPIFALTNLQLPEEVSEALEAGVDGYLSKPENPEDLADELAVVLIAEESGVWAEDLE